jgi:hypothetical protein
MVTRALTALCLALSACSPLEGTVLIARDAQEEAASDAASDAQEQPPPGAAGDAGADEGARDAGDASPDAGSATRGACRIGGAKDGFYEDFSKPLSASRWLLADGPVQIAGLSAQGGYARDNVNLEAGTLIMRVRGDQYDGPVRSHDGEGKPLASGKRSAAALVTRDLFASATYQVQGRFVGPPGVEVALWFVRDDDSEGAIMIGTPGLDGATRSYAFVSMQTRDGSASASNEFALGATFDDRGSHILRFDWYTTMDNAAVFWVDDMRRFELKRNLPSRRAGRLWIVARVRDGATAAFDTAEIRIENAFVTPFADDGDECMDGELSGPALVPP